MSLTSIFLPQHGTDPGTHTPHRGLSDTCVDTRTWQMYAGRGIMGALVLVNAWCHMIRQKAVIFIRKRKEKHGLWIAGFSEKGWGHKKQYSSCVLKEIGQVNKNISIHHAGIIQIYSKKHCQVWKQVQLCLDKATCQVSSGLNWRNHTEEGWT